MDSIKQEKIDSEEIDDEYLMKWTECPVTDVCKNEIKEQIKIEENRENSKQESKPDNSKETQRSSEKYQVKNVNQLCPKEKVVHINYLIQKLCLGVPLSEKVSNLCLFTCPKCKEEFKGWNNIKRHVTQKHHRPHNIFMTEVDSLISKTIAHNCKICSEKVLCDSAFITRHLANHNMTLHHYTMLFSANAVKNMLKVKNSDNVIGSLCVYQCIDCGKKFESKGKVARHISKTFQMKNIKIFDSIIERVYHHCKLCNEPVLCEQANLHDHFLRRHNVTTAKYCKRYNVTHHSKRITNKASLMESLKISKNIDNLCVFACPLCQEKHFTVYRVTLNSINTSRFSQFLLIYSRDFPINVIFVVSSCCVTFIPSIRT